MAIIPSRIRDFSRCPPTQCSTYRAPCVDADTGFSFGRCGWRAVCSRSLERHTRRWPSWEPSCFSPCQASSSRQLFSLIHTAETDFLHNRRLTRLHTTRHIHRVGHVSLQLHVLQFFFESQFASRSCGDSIIYCCICRSCVGIDEVGLIVFCSTNLGGSGVSISASILLYSCRRFD